MIESTSSVIVPTTITDSLLVSCSVAEPAPGETVWVSGTTYAIGDIRILVATHKKYKRLVAGAGTTTPNLDTVNWLDIGPTNKWAQFDQKIGTATTAPSVLTTVLTPGSAEGLALMDLKGTSVNLSIKDKTGGTVVYTKSVSLDGSIVTDVYDWMFGEYLQKLNVIFTDLPGQYTSAEITCTVNSTSGASVGVLVLGRVQKLGSAKYGSGAGIINWGKVSDDGFGNRTWIAGDWSNRITLPLVVNTSDFAALHRRLSSLRSTPAIYIGSELSSMEPLICYGVYKDLYITVPNLTTCDLNLEIEGLNNNN